MSSGIFTPVTDIPVNIIRRGDNFLIHLFITIQVTAFSSHDLATRNAEFTIFAKSFSHVMLLMGIFQVKV
jgi:hypothetical protein